MIIKNLHIATGILLLLVIVSVFVLWNFNIIGMTTSFFGISSNPADINNDGFVDNTDRNEFLDLYEKHDPLADIDKNGIIDFNDAMQYISLYQENQ